MKKNKYRQQILDIFKSHYDIIWNNITNVQKTLCINLIMKENMNINETDYIINKLYNKEEHKFPITELCKKYIQQYCEELRNIRETA